MRIAVLFDHLGPYHLARIRAAGTKHEILSVQVRLRSLEYRWQSPDLPEEIRQVTLQRTPGAATIPIHELVHGLDELVSGFRPEVCFISGWSTRASFVALRWSLSRRIPVVLMSESSAHDEVRTPWREAVKRRYVALASAALVGGTLHRAYLRELGMPDERIFDGYDAVDNESFARESSRWRETDAPQPPCFLASNRFIEKKNLFRLLSAYARYAHSATETEARPPWPLVLLGDGELKTKLLAHAAGLGLAIHERAPWEPAPHREDRGSEARATLYLPGFRQIDELPRFYAHAGAFVHASTTEQWGLVVNEAMASGLPVIVSNRCGCAPDLVRDGENGWTFDPFDEEGLAGLLARMSRMEAPARAAFGEAARRRIAEWGPLRYASGLEEASRTALAVGCRPIGPINEALLAALSIAHH